MLKMKTNVLVEMNKNNLMKRGINYLNHDIRNIIETMEFQYRMKNINNEYRQVFHFFDVLYYDDTECPNSYGRCVTKYIDITIHWLDRKLHRKHGPAIEWSNGTKEWYVKRQRHRLDGPALEWADGDKYWYYKNQLHRENGPAIEHANGTKEWYYMGRLHRDTKEGPAVEYTNGRPNEYWEFGNRIRK